MFDSAWRRAPDSSMNSHRHLHTGSVRVDDGRTWDNCAEVCDGFYARLEERFSITRGGGLTYMIGMDIALGDGWVKLCSSTYILNLCARWLDYPIGEYDYIGILPLIPS